MANAAPARFMHLHDHSEARRHGDARPGPDRDGRPVVPRRGAGAHHAVSRRLVVALVITAALMAVEIAGSYWTNSLALLADAGHMLSDVAALGLTLFAAWLAGKPHSATRSYGYRRAEILAALANGMILWGVAAYIFVEAVGRVREPPQVHGVPMLLIAVAGLAANLLSAWALVGESHHSLNIRGALLHVLGDALGSGGAILAAVLILAFGWSLADPLISVFIGTVLLVGSTRLVRPAVHILLEGAPAELDMADLEQAILGSSGVLAVHDLHAWTLTSGYNAVTAHVVLSESIPPADREHVLDDLRHMIPRRFPVRHLTVQLEESSYCCGEEDHLPGSRAGGPAGKSAHAHGEEGDRD